MVQSCSMYVVRLFVWGLDKRLISNDSYRCCFGVNKLCLLRKLHCLMKRLKSLPKRGNQPCCSTLSQQRKLNTHSFRELNWCGSQESLITILSKHRCLDVKCRIHIPCTICLRRWAIRHSKTVKVPFCLELWTRERGYNWQKATFTGNIPISEMLESNFNLPMALTEAINSVLEASGETDYKLFY